MSELIQKNANRATIRWKLLTGASALALAVPSPSLAADSDSHPLLWLEIGGNADLFSGAITKFSPGFAEISPTPGPYRNGGSPIDVQKPERFTFGGEAQLQFQPSDSDWVFSAGIRYGRSNNKRNVHHQTSAVKQFPNPAYQHLAYFYPSYLAYYPSIKPNYTKYAPKFAGTRVSQSERHMVLDFQAGKDVGLGLFGRGGTSVISAGVRMARFRSHSQVTARAQPDASFYSKKFANPWGGGPHATYTIYENYWRNYYMQASASRDFKGIGPSLSWKAAVPLAGNVQQGELELDLGVNGAVLFGKQKAKVSHHTSGRKLEPKYYHYFQTPGGHTRYDNYFSLYPPINRARNQSHSVTVPNLGALIGLSYRIENTKISFGYRSDYFFGAMDGGIDKAKKTTLSFNGLYASVSIGLGD